jgi:uncharacterized protein
LVASDFELSWHRSYLLFYERKVIVSPTLTAAQLDQRARLLDRLRALPPVVVAFSGGVDSAVVAQAAFLAQGERAWAVTADSPSVPRAEIAGAIALAQHIGIRHRVLATAELADPAYVANDGARCYFCKRELYGRLSAVLAELGASVIVSGANADDAGDYRPGLRAAAEAAVVHPLQEVGCTKADVRVLAQAWHLPVWDKPAGPCLASRLAPGVQVTAERLAQVEAAETYLRRQGVRDCRVRLHEGDLARVEVPLADLLALAQPAARHELVTHLQQLGFRYVTLDLAGLRSGSMNDLVPLETRRLFLAETPP